jgi:uncharacterized protein YbjQ (UPF0145 family)
MVVALRGENVTVTIPRQNPATGTPIKPGDAFRYATPSERDKVIASTLPTIPGMEIVQSKPVIWAIVSEAFFRFHMTNDQKEQTHMAKRMGGLLTDAQNKLLKKAIEVGCNAVLGMTVNVTTDSSGSRGNSKIVIVTVCGTPCSVMPMQEVPTVTAQAITPLYAMAI